MPKVNWAVGHPVGLNVGDSVGLAEGDSVGFWVGDTLGLCVGVWEGLCVGEAVGEAVGAGVSAEHGVFAVTPLFSAISASEALSSTVTAPRNALLDAFIFLSLSAAQ